MLVKNQIRRDSAEAMYFARELESMKPALYEVMYPGIKYAEAIPTSPDKNPGAQFVTYKMYDKNGVAKVVASYADDIPRVDLEGKEFQVRVHRLAAACGYTIDELRGAQTAGRGLDQFKLRAVGEAVERLIDRLAFLGDTDIGIVGLTNIPNMPNTVVASVSAQTTWAAKAALGTEAGFNGILADLNAPFIRMATATKGHETPDTIALSPTSMAELATYKFPGTGVGVLEFFRQQRRDVAFIEVHWLEDSGTGGAKQMIVYRRDPMKLELEVPEDLNYLDPQQRNLEEIVIGTAKCAGVQCRYPLSLDSSYGM